MFVEKTRQRLSPQALAAYQCGQYDFINGRYEPTRHYREFYEAGYFDECTDLAFAKGLVR